jgi:hypothetical protein
MFSDSCSFNTYVFAFMFPMGLGAAARLVKC